MSVQFGRWNLSGQPIDPLYAGKVRDTLVPYGPDGCGSYIKGNIAIFYCAFNTTEESHTEVQPHFLQSGPVLTWDGRLDNRPELAGELSLPAKAYNTDLEIVSAAYERWGTACFSKLIGDWAIAIWNRHARCLLLARDCIGPRHLYYSVDEQSITWCTVLDPLVLFADKQLTLCEEYIAGWLSLFPATHLTPYQEIRSVPPSTFVELTPQKQVIRKYWDFDPKARIRHASDADYEEHFRAVFALAVQRRLRANAPILAELSGGMDSSSIVCMADALAKRGADTGVRVDTLSYLDDSEPNWNERPFVLKVEEQRGKSGCHIDVSSRNLFTFDHQTLTRVFVSPSACRNSDDSSHKFEEYLQAQGNRVLLSGIGGDEVTGGVPTPMPEFEDLLAGAQFRQLAHQLKMWALNKRKPWFYLLAEAVSGFLPPSLFPPRKRRPPNWLKADFISRNRHALHGYIRRLTLFGASPSFQENLSTLDCVRRQLTVGVLSDKPLYEARYPYLDRTLLEFLYAIPREQLVRPGQRRSLMRRALIGIVPEDVLNRKRKACVSRGAVRLISAAYPIMFSSPPEVLTGLIGIVDPNRLITTLHALQNGLESPRVQLIRILGAEIWLRNARETGTLAPGDVVAVRSSQVFEQGTCT